MKSNPLDPICDGSPIRTRKCSTVLWHLNCCYATKLGVRPVQDGGRISRRPAANRVSSLYMISMQIPTLAGLATWERVHATGSKCARPARSHFTRWLIRTNSLVQIYTIFAKSYVFYELPIHMNLYEWPTPNPAPKPTRHWGLDKT